MAKGLMWSEVHKNVFFITNDQGEGVIYSPLQGKFFSADSESQEIVREYIEMGAPKDHYFQNVLDEAEISITQENPETPKNFPYKPTGIMLSLSNLCNLRCVYCYAEAGRIQPKTLAENVINQSIKKIFEYAVETNEKTVEIAFHGTGETLVKWNDFVKAVSFSKSIKPEQVEIEFSLVTNGTLLDVDKATFLANHSFFVSLSMDGIQTVQDKQRPTASGKGSFDNVINGIKALVRADVAFVVRSTITGDNINDMPEFVQLCADLGVKQISLMPFSAVGSGATAGITPLDAKLYVDNYLKSKEIAKRNDIHLSMAGTQIDKVNTYFCGVIGSNCVVTPEGQISTCSRITKASDSLASKFIIGEVNKSGFSIDEAKANELIHLNLYSYNYCQTCFAKYVCTGGCPHDRLSSNNNMMPAHWCEIVRNVVWHEIRDLAIEK